MAIVVRPKSGRGLVVRQTAAARQPRLVIGLKPGGTLVSPLFDFSLADGSGPLVSGTATRFAPPLVRRLDEPASITVVNSLAEPSAAIGIAWSWRATSTVSPASPVPVSAGTVHRP